MNVLYFLTPKSEIYYLDNDSTLRQALEKMDYHKFTVIPLIDQAGRYVSTISEGDILRVIKNCCSFNLSMAESIRLSDIERYRPYRCLKVTASMKEIIELLMNQNFVPLVDDRDIFIGIVKRKNVIEYYYRQLLKAKEEKQYDKNL